MPTRLRSLDAFRGATILLMVLVNNGGGDVSYAQLEHSEWNGWTLTDTVFPAFLWIVGVAITLSRPKSPARILRRATVLYVLGLLLYMYPTMSWSHQRLLGVLQRIAICYLIVSLIYLYTGVRTQIVCIAGLFVIYWLLMTQVNVPGYGPGHLDVERNFAHYVDWIVLGTHNYARTKTWDPEGIVSTFPAIATTLLGVMAGHILRLGRTMPVRRNCLFGIGAGLIALGLVWNIWLPINKKLWTDSFATFMAGLDFVVLAALVWFVDERDHGKHLRPLLITGLNAITIYVASEVLQGLLDFSPMHELIYSHFIAPYASPKNASLLWALAFTGLMYGLAYLMYRRRWFIRI